MDLIGRVRSVGRRWLLVGALVGVGVGGAGYAAAAQPAEPSATTRLYVSVSSATSLADLDAQSRWTAQVADSYASVATAPFVLEPVIEELGLPLTVRQLAEKVRSTVEDGTVVIRITVSDDSSARATRIADAIAHRLVAATDSLTPTGKGPKVRLTQVEAARPSS